MLGTMGAIQRVSYEASVRVPMIAAGPGIKPNALMLGRIKRPCLNDL